MESTEDFLKRTFWTEEHVLTDDGDVMSLAEARRYFELLKEYEQNE